MSEDHEQDVTALAADIRRTRRELAHTVSQLVESTDVKRRTRNRAAMLCRSAIAAPKGIWTRAILASQQIRRLLRPEEGRVPVPPPGETDRNT